MRKILKIFAQYFFILLISFILLEAILFFLYQNYSLINKLPALKPYFKGYYAANRSIIQLNPECAKYDQKLFYTLKPGVCIFKNKEFETKYQINKIGVRDDEESLKKPEIIILGDSYAMGWGTDQNNNFAALLEEKLGVKILNSAISSYGTAREYLMLKNLDKSKLKYLIIQYCPNDYPENKLFIENNFNLKISPQSEYEDTVAKHLKKAGKYKVFKFSSILIRNISRQIRHKNVEAKIDTKTEFDAFSQILKLIQKDVGKNVKIILFANDSYGSLNSDLDNYFKDKKIKNLIVFDASKILSKEDYFILDDHMNKNGHTKIANEIYELIKSQNK